MKEVMSALITPFLQNGDIDYDALGCLVEQQIVDGVHGFIVCGTTAEVPTLTRSEKLSILDYVIDKTQERVPIWYGCGSNCTSIAIQNIHDVEGKAIAGVLIVTPYYNRPSQEGIYQHYMAIAKSTKCPIMLYNIPSRTGCAIEEETLFRLLQDSENIVALKHASKDLCMIEHIVQTFPNFKVYSGEDNFFVEGFCAGMCGMISVMSHIILQPLLTFIEQNCENEALQQDLYICAQHVFMESSPAPLKYLMSKQHRVKNILRLPLVGVSDHTIQQLDDWMAEYDRLLALKYV